MPLTVNRFARSQVILAGGKLLALLVYPGVRVGVIFAVLVKPNDRKEQEMIAAGLQFLGLPVVLDEVFGSASIGAIVPHSLQTLHHK